MYASISRSLLPYDRSLLPDNRSLLTLAHTPATWLGEEGVAADAFGAWVSVSSVDKPDALWTAWDHAQEDAGLVVQVGALCPATQEVKAITSNYAASGDLRTVVLSQGFRV